VVDLTFTPSATPPRRKSTPPAEGRAEGPLKGVLGYSDEPLVSIDYNHARTARPSTASKPR
jgi:glyceraldehyde 3-phosphate dehydrogenase